MKKRNKIKKEVKKNKKLVDSKVNKRINHNEVDLWKEIRSNLKPLSKAYNKFREKRRIAKQKEEEKRLKEDEQLRLREEEALRLQEQEERRFQKEKKIKEEKRIKLKEQEDQRLEAKKIIEDRDEQIRQEQIYSERLLKGEEERIEQLKRVNELREEERKIREERNLEIIREERNLEIKKSKSVWKQTPEDKEQILKEEKQRLQEKEQRLKEKELRLQEEEQRLKKDEKINLKEGRKSDTDDKQKKKRLNGTVLWFSDAKGYGFIKREDKEKDVFVHSSAVENSGLTYLKEAEQLTFEVEHSDKGPSAINIQKTVNEASRPHLKVVK